MKKIFKKSKIFLIFLSFFIIAVLAYFNFSKSNLPIQLAQAGVYDSAAGTGHNLRGFAWSSNIGWISFNSTDCDNNGNIYLGNPAGCPVNGTAFFDYGVYIDNNTGDISGFAWSENVGWISFNRENYCESGVNIGKTCANSGDCDGATCGGDSAGKTGDPLYPPYNSTTGTIAKYNTGTHVIDGWAKILSMGDDGWISFNCSNNGGSCGTSDYKVIANVTNSELEGWAWNGNDDDSGIGWISFNCKGYNVCNGTGDNGEVCSIDSDCPSAEAGSCVPACNITNYKVEAQLNQKPWVNNLTAPQWTWTNSCDNDDALRASLSWTIHDDSSNSISAYQLVLKSTTDLEQFNTGKCIGLNICDVGDPKCEPSECRLDPSNYSNANTMLYTLNSGDLIYNYNYKWEVRIWDDLGEPSDWKVFDTDNGDTATDGNPDFVFVGDGSEKTFTTYKHEFPQPYFTWSPAQPAIDEEVLFISRKLSLYGNSDTECTTDDCGYSWEYTGDSADCKIGPPDNASSTIIIFKKKINYSDGDIELTVTDKSDSLNYSCSTSTTFNIKQKLPMWIEAR